MFSVDDTMLGIQGHPEFSQAFMRNRLIPEYYDPVIDSKRYSEYWKIYEKSPLPDIAEIFKFCDSFLKQK